MNASWIPFIMLADIKFMSLLGISVILCSQAGMKSRVGKYFGITSQLLRGGFVTKCDR